MKHENYYRRIKHKPPKNTFYKYKLSSGQYSLVITQFSTLNS